MKYIYITLASLFLFASCDFLEPDQYGVTTKIEDMTDEQALNLVYGLYHWQYKEGTTGRGYMWYENCSDNFVTGRTNSDGDNLKNFYDKGTTGRDVKDNWPLMYETIHHANTIIGQIDAATQLAMSTRNTLLGNAHFARGFAYMWLAPWYGDNGVNGGIPIVTEKDEIANIKGQRPASVLENYDMIIADMDKAANFLPYFNQLSLSEYGQMHKTAAWTIAARAALFAAQYDPAYYDKVIKYTDLVIGSGQHDLVKNYADVFTAEQNWSKEYIISIVSNTKDGSKLPGMSFQNAGFGLYNTWGYFQPTAELHKAFENNDSRLAKTIIMPGDSVQFVGKKLCWGFDPSNISSPTGMTFGKYLDPFKEKGCSGTTVNPDSDNATTTLNIPIARYADVLLMKAEALIWKNGEGDAVAKSLIDDIRERAKLPRNSQATKAQLKNERRCEFVMEFGTYRHLDLVRWGDAKAIYDLPLHGYIIGGTSTSPQLTIKEVWRARNNFDPSIHHVFAIPNKEVRESTSLEQNNGYK